MRRALTIAGRLALLLVPLGLGIAILAGAVYEREAPVPRERAEPATAVRVITVEPAPFSPQVTAFGTVEPASTWRAAAQVSGEVVRLAPDLRPGHLVEAGTEIVRIDATDYELAEAQAAARLTAVEARLAELGVTRDNLGASLRIERRALDLAETELARHRTLLQRGTSSQTAVDRAEEAMLARRRAVQEIENALKLLPAQIRVQEAEGRIARARLDEARRAIARTVVTMPFDGRIAQVSVEREQFVATGETMLVAEDIGRVEVSARLRLEQLETLVTDRERLAAALDRGTAAIDDAL